MKKILFVCHGNICRSPMAEFVFKNMARKKGISDEFHISSAATSNEEIGNGVYPLAVRELNRNGIKVDEYKRAIRITQDDYRYYDMIIVMEQYNIRNLLSCIGEDRQNKIWKLLDFEFPESVKQCRGNDISDPWYHGDFSKTYCEITSGCAGLLEYLGYK